MNWKVAIAVVSVAGVLSGCSAYFEAWESMIGVDESRPKIKEKAVEYCSTLPDSEKQTTCKGQALVAFDACEEKSGLSVKKNCYKDVFNDVREILIENCDKQADKEACLKRVPNPLKKD
jgi:hypothetical protein